MNTSKMKLVAIADAYHGTIAEVEDYLCIYESPDGLVLIVDSETDGRVSSYPTAENTREDVDLVVGIFDATSGWTIDMESTKYF